jgi:hypothetical protein
MIIIIKIINKKVTKNKRDFVVAIRTIHYLL